MKLLEELPSLLFWAPLIYNLLDKTTLIFKGGYMRNIQDGRRPVRDEDRRQDLTEIHEERRNRELRLQSRKKRKRKRLIIGIASAVGTLILLVV
nr:hypothetical protein [Clostridia bacterium]